LKSSRTVSTENAIESRFQETVRRGRKDNEGTELMEEGEARNSGLAEAGRGRRREIVACVKWERCTLRRQREEEHGELSEEILCQPVFSFIVKTTLYLCLTIFFIHSFNGGIRVAWA